MMANSYIIGFVALICIFNVAVNAYKPVLLMHGYSMKSGHGAYTDFDDIISWIAEDHPGVNIFY